MKTPAATPRARATRRTSTVPVVLITGASQGIGEAIALTFARELAGVRLALVARQVDQLRRVAKACRKLGAEARVFPADVGDAASVDALAASVLRVWSEVDVLINNAGRFVPGTFLETTVADFDANVVANLRSVFLVSRAFVPGMISRGRGDVFNMSSIAGLQAYAAAKFGVTGLSKVMRADLRSKGVRVCTVYPGATVSPAWAGSGVPAERMMPAGDVARAFLDVYRLTRRTVVEEIVLRPQAGDV
jgi:NADP-dependent 3-hydroxy acid dehydrogenase YdfG